MSANRKWFKLLVWFLFLAILCNGYSWNVVNAQSAEDVLSEPENYTNPYNSPKLAPPVNEHPRLFARKGDLPQIKANLAKGNMPAVWQKVVANAATAVQPGSYNTDVIGSNALIYLLYGDKNAGNLAVDILEGYYATGATPTGGTRAIGDLIYTTALVYDWCYDLMNDEQRLNFRVQVDRMGKDMEISYPPTGQGAVVGHGAEAQLMRDLLSFGVASYDENPNLYNIAAGRFFNEYVPARNFEYESGMHSQGSSYGMYRYSFDLYALWMFDRMGLGNVFSPKQQFVPYHDIYTRRPDGQLLREGDDYQSVYTSPGVLWSSNIDSVFLSSSYYKDPYLRNEYLRQASAGANVNNIWMVLFNDPDLDQKVKREQDLPLSHYFGYPHGEMIARTNWEGNVNSNAVVAQMNIGGMNFVNHQQLDAGSFQIYYKGALALDSGLYEGTAGSYGSSHDINYHKRTIAHNSMLVFDPDEQFKWYGNAPAVNDGGQRFPNDYKEPSTLTELLDPDKGYEVAHVLQHAQGPDANTPDFTFIKGDLTDAYTDKVSDYKRSMVFLNLKDNSHPAAMLVFDKLSSAQATFKKTWLLHSIAEPEIQGNTQTITNEANAYNGKLVNTTLLPAGNAAVISKVGGTGQEFSTNGVNYPQTPKSTSSSIEPGSWRIEISPSQPAQTDTFLNVMQVLDSDNGPAPLVTESVSGDGVVGAKLSDRVVLFSESGQPINDEVTFDIQGNDENLYILATDVAPGYWTVQKVGAEPAAYQYKVDAEEGTLYFKGGAGSYVLTRSDVSTLPEAPAVSNIPMPESINPITVALNGQQLELNHTPQFIDGNLMVPAAELLAGLGGRVESNPQTGEARAIKLGQSFGLTAGSTKVTSENGTVELKSAARIMNGEFYVPLELIDITGWGTSNWNEFARKIEVRTVVPKKNYGLTAVKTSGGEPYSGERTVDGNPGTAWVVSGAEGWISYDLGQLKPVNKIGISWYKGSERHVKYDIQTSANGTDWRTVYSGENSGVSDQVEDVVFPTELARYIRIVSKGYLSASGWVGQHGINETIIYSAKLAIKNVRAIGFDVGSEPNKALDGNYSTYWTVEGTGKWIEFDLGSSQTVTAVSTAWSKGDVRQQNYDIQLSMDQNNWETVFSGRNSGTTLQNEYVYFPSSNARYVRVVGNKNTVNGYNSLTEAAVFGVAGVPAASLTGVTGEYDEKTGEVRVSGNVSTGVGQTINVVIQAPNGHTVFDKELTSDQEGRFAATYTVSGSDRAGLYAITIGGQGISNPQTRTFYKQGKVEENTNTTPSPTLQEGKILIQPIKSGEVASGQVDSKTLEQAYNQVSGDAQGNKTVVLELEGVDGATEYRQELPRTFFSSNASGNGTSSIKKVIVATPLGSIALSERMLKLSELTGGGRIEIAIASVNPSTLQLGSRDKVKLGPVVELKLLLNSKPVAWNNAGSPVEVSVNYVPNGISQEQLEHIVVWYIGDNGQVTRIPNGRFDSAQGKVTFRTSHFSKYAVAYDKVTFEDLSSVPWAKQAIEVLASKGIIYGISAENFAPQANITRGDFLKLLIGTLGLQAEVEDNFDDVSRSDYYYEAAGIAKKLGICIGVGNNKLNPKASVTREDMAVMAEKALKAAGKETDRDQEDSLSPFKDASLIAGYAQDSIAALVQSGLIQGHDNRIDPQGSTTRAEAAVLLYRIYNLN